MLYSDKVIINNIITQQFTAPTRSRSGYIDYETDAMHNRSFTTPHRLMNFITIAISVQARNQPTIHSATEVQEGHDPATLFRTNPPVLPFRSLLFHTSYPFLSSTLRQQVASNSS